MKKKMRIIPLLLILVLAAACSQEKKLLRKASVAVDQSDFEKALGYYDQAIEKNDKSFFGNAGKGIVLSEYMARHEQAIPYLEKALANSPPDKTKPILHGNLGKSYHFIGNYARALTYYGKLDNDPDYSDYDEFLTKRIADCKFALEHPEVASPENQNIANAGNVINTDKPEYTPVMVNNNLYFTSKRQDDPKEKKNGIDGKFFESVYVSSYKDGTFSEPKKLNLSGAEAMKNKKFGEAVASASPDGKKLFLYKGGKLFETDLSDESHNMKELDKSINFSKLQNHASLSPDGNTMYFTSESDKGRGGSDIYYATRNGDGTWSEPKSLDYIINTPNDEEAPYVSENGDLFFSSNGHPGYGGFDVYRTRQVNGGWMKPENLGQPINSPGDDIFFTLGKNSSKGYYASARPGGHGDLDIYKVHYVIDEVQQCNPADNLLAINAEPALDKPMTYQVQVSVPDQYKNTVRSYRWELNGKALAQTSPAFSHTFSGPDTYKLVAKVVAGCDTCPRLIGMCAEKTIEVKQEILAKNENTEDSDKALAANAKGKKKNSKGKKSGANESEDAASSGAADKKAKDEAALAANLKNAATEKGPNTKPESGRNSGAEATSVLGETELNSINWNSNEAYFDYNEYQLKEDAKRILDQNISILKSREDLKININGYADARGTEAYNKQLSQKRANAVREYLLSNGVKANRIRSVKGHGESDLLNNCSDGVECDESQHQKNRRVKFEVMGKPVTLTLN